MTAAGLTIPPWTGRRRANALDTTRRHGARLHLPCSICGQPINYQLRYPNPASCTVQHIKSRFLFPELTWDPANWAPAHLDCNQSAGDGTNPVTNGQLGAITPLWDLDAATQATGNQPRHVILLCGPPGAGKTTLAHQSGLTIYDRDDPHWTNDTDFNNALTTLGHTPNAQAVVIRAGATTTARNTTRQQIGATHTYLVLLDPTEAAHRITQRNRADKTKTLAGLTTWWKRHDNNDHTPTFPGWHNIPHHTPTP